MPFLSQEIVKQLEQYKIYVSRNMLISKRVMFNEMVALSWSYTHFINSSIDAYSYSNLFSKIKNTFIGSYTSIASKVKTGVSDHELHSALNAPFWHGYQDFEFAGFASPAHDGARGASLHPALTEQARLAAFKGHEQLSLQEHLSLQNQGEAPELTSQISLMGQIDFPKVQEEQKLEVKKQEEQKREEQASLSTRAKIPQGQPTWPTSEHNPRSESGQRSLQSPLASSDYNINRSNIVEIGHDVWIGEGAIIAANVKIGTGAVIGAASVITKDVPPYAIVVGYDRHLRNRFKDEVISDLIASQWWRYDIPAMWRNGIEFPYTQPEHLLKMIQDLDPEQLIPLQDRWIALDVPETQEVVTKIKLQEITLSDVRKFFAQL